MTTQQNGRLRKLTNQALGVGVIATSAALAWTGIPLTAYANSTSAETSSSYQATFIAHYNQNLQLQSQLLQKAEADGGTGTTITSLKQTVQTINAQVSALYAAEQSLASASASIVKTPASSTQAAQLKADKQKLEQDINAAKLKVKVDMKSKQYVAARRMQLQIKTWQAEINKLNFELNHLNNVDTLWQRFPYDHGLSDLQQSIFDLQKSSIHYTEAWINAAKSVGNPVSETGLAYNTANVTVPTAGSAAIVDGVAVMPIVKDSEGDVLTDSGTFNLVGPAGAQGVSIDNTTGQVTVNAGATAGTYVVTYTQGTVSDSVSIVVFQ